MAQQLGPVASVLLKLPGMSALARRAAASYQAAVGTELRKYGALPFFFFPTPPRAAPAAGQRQLGWGDVATGELPYVVEGERSGVALPFPFLPCRCPSHLRPSTMGRCLHWRRAVGVTGLHAPAGPHDGQNRGGGGGVGVWGGWGLLWGGAAVWLLPCVPW